MKGGILSLITIETAVQQTTARRVGGVAEKYPQVSV